MPRLNYHFIDSFKTELITDRIWQTRSQLELAVVEYIARFNHQRLHESLGDSPQPSPNCSTSSATRPRHDRFKTTTTQTKRKPTKTVSVG